MDALGNEGEVKVLSKGPSSAEIRGLIYLSWEREVFTEHLILFSFLSFWCVCGGSQASVVFLLE